LGKSSGWASDISLSTADASFIGENAGDIAGSWGLDCSGDINNDGYNDIIIGAHGNDDGGNGAGKIYVVFGKSTGWAMDTDLSGSDASFIGISAGYISGVFAQSGGDFNGDGFDDIAIGSYGDKVGIDAGEAYVIFGKTTGWSNDVSLNQADISYLGENAGDFGGAVLNFDGDINGDGFDDLLISGLYNDEGGTDAGQVYVIFGFESGDTVERVRTVSSVGSDYFTFDIDLTEDVQIEYEPVCLGNEKINLYCLSDPTSSLSKLGLEYLLGIDADTFTEWGVSITECSSRDDLISQIQNDPNGIGFINMDGLSAPSGLRFIEFKGDGESSCLPTSDNIKNGLYEGATPVYAVVPSNKWNNQDLYEIMYGPKTNQDLCKNAGMLSLYIS
jgi:hypothetical protein